MDLSNESLSIRYIEMAFLPIIFVEGLCVKGI